MKKCPFCAEEIQAEAKKCKHCGEFLDQETKENRNGIGNFSRCRILKENEGSVNIRCPKCGFHGKAKEVDGDYNSAIFRVLFLFFPVVGGILYYLFTTKTKYLCPNCLNDYLEVLSQASNEEELKKEKKLNSDTIGILFLIGFMGLMIILFLSSK